ncbi:MAG: universal stress protein [Candidatus Heimdallarchaeota archaeon]|nr:universal stress protein [Candidatus Heimdallarchaeota archaeon]
MTSLSKNLHPDYQDEFFLNLDRILVPVGGKEFECMGLELAFYIAHEYGAHLDLLHVGIDPGKSINNYLKKLAKYEIEHDLIVIDNKNVSQTIIDYWKKRKHNLVIMSSRRRPTFFDKITVKSISSTAIPEIHAEVLQVFPPNIKKMSAKLQNVAVLLPYSKRDPFLLRWASSIAAPQKGAKIRVYHIARVPEVVPLRGARNEEEIKKEEKIFKDYMDNYAKIFGQIIKPKFVIGYKIISSLRFIFGKDEPDIVIIGQSKKRNIFQKLSKSLSSKIRDNLLNTGVCIHHML